jgi:hypothetical protein
MESKFETREALTSSQSLQEAKLRLWKSMIEDFELTWLKDVPSSAASRIVDLTLHKMRDNRAREEAWRLFFNECVGA